MKKLMVLLMVMVLLLAGCSQKEESVDELIIGHYSPLTGSIATSGQAGSDGAALAVELWNKNGGVNGKQVKYIVYDDQSTPEGAVKAVTRLIEVDQIHGLIGSQLSGNIQATGELVEDAKIPEVGTGISTVWPKPEWSYLFRALSNNNGGPGPLVAAMNEIGVKSVSALVFQDEGSRNSWDKLVEVIEDAGIDVTTVEVFQPLDTDWTGQIGSMINSGADSMVVMAQGEQLGNLLKQIRTMGYNGYVFANETSTLPDVRKVAGEAADGQLFYAPYAIPDSVADATSPAEVAFLEAFVEKFGEPPVSDVAYRCFDAVNILLTGFERADSIDGEAVRDAIYEINDLQTLGGTADFSATRDGECMSGFQLYITHEGKNILWDVFKEENDVGLYFTK